MKTWAGNLSIFFLLIYSAASTRAAVLYVNVNSSNPSPPYADWSTAATSIQVAVDASTTGDLILVTNGVYNTGGHVVYGSMNNRVAVTKAITVQSVNGSGVTSIQGFQVSSTTNGNSAIRCVYLTNGAALIGFTLTNGATRQLGDFTHEQSGGGVWCEGTNAFIYNCFITRNAAYYGGGGAYSGTLSNCTLAANNANLGGGANSNCLYGCTLKDNTAYAGGGAANGILLDSCVLSNNASVISGGGTLYSTLNNCTLEGNSSTNGGGVIASILTGCVLTSNTAKSVGGGAENSTLTNCTLSGNVSYVYGGGAEQCTTYNCTFIGNSAVYGGGTSGGRNNNCLLSSNSATLSGGGSFACSDLNCTIIANSANSAGGKDGGRSTNCIVYHNNAPGFPNYRTGTTFDHSCTTPLPDGVGNISVEPGLADSFRLTATSACRGAGIGAVVIGADIDGEPWLNPASMGCDEFYPGTASGALNVTVKVANTSVAVGFPLNFIATVTGAANANYWNFGDGTVVSNSSYVSHAWSVPGNYDVVFWVYNNSNPNRLSATTSVQVVTQPVYYVRTNNAGALAPYDSWATAATNIQDAVGIASIPGSLILVSNGLYNAGSKVVNGVYHRVALTIPLTLQSVNGPAVTRIDGVLPPPYPFLNDGVRCVYLADGASLVGFTLTRGGTHISGDQFLELSGGAVWCASPFCTVSNCVLLNSIAAAGGGGSFSGTLINCSLTNNSAATNGGGAYGSILINCVLSGNSSSNGGGAFLASLTGCTVTNNRAYKGGGVYTSLLTACVLASNSATNGGGAYAGILNNCTLINNSATSLGGGANSGTLNDCLLTNNFAPNGGGAYFSTLNNCFLIGNTASLFGGGADSATLNSCILVGNSSHNGGGDFGSTLNGCTLTANKATSSGGGANSSTLRNCIVYYNTAPIYPNINAGSIKYCCTTPLPIDIGNITNEPLFLNVTNDFHLQSSSPCINAGNNSFRFGPTDFDANPRTVGGTVDMGAYEYQTPSSVLSYAWAQQYGLATDGSADFAESDGDGMNNWQEWIAGTIPTDSNSFLQILPPSLTNSTGVTITWQSVSNRTYFLQTGTNLSFQPAFVSIQSNIVGQAGTTSFIDTTATNNATYFYRVGIQ
jgi:PKD domain-containing protein